MIPSGNITRSGGRNANSDCCVAASDHRTACAMGAWASHCGAVVYVGALVVALIIGLILIGYQQIRARLNDPELLERRRVNRLIQRSNEAFKEPPPKWQQREDD